jgi:hypothetical protein
MRNAVGLVTDAGRIDAAIAAAFREVGPADERYLDWRKSDVEPWRTIARNLGTR